MYRARLIYNPSSGREQIRKLIPDLLEQLEAAGYETSCHATKGEGDAERAAQWAAQRQFDVVIAAGGDGTIYEVVNGLARQPNRPKMGILPAGTTNNFARALDLPRDIPEACQVIEEGVTQSIDIGQANEHYFISIAGGGALTEVSYEVASKWKTILGQFAYFAKGIEKLVFLKPTRMRVESKEHIIDEEIMLFLVSNSKSIGGFDTLTPFADVQDGFLDVLIVMKMSIPEFMKLATRSLRGEHVHDPRVVYYKTKALTVTSDHHVQVNLDGELGGHLPCRFRVLHKHLTVFVPKKES
jgi:diacylglycerol kinase (ATP)